MRFEQALRQNPAPRSVGDVTLSYEAPVLVGETATPSGRVRLLPELLFVAALIAGVVAVALLVAAPGDSLSGPVTLALIAGVLVAVAGRAERRVRHRRRFVLHFGEESLRLDLPGGLARRPLSRTVHFDRVRDVYVVPRADGRYTLRVDFVTGDGVRARVLSATLVDGVGEAETEELSRLWTTLRAAFGLRPAPGES